VPGSSQTYVYGINDSGQVAGYFTDSAGGYGFIDADGVFTAISAPGSSQTYVIGINDSGQVVGYDGGAFVYTGGEFNTIDNPFPPGTHIYPYGINDNGQITVNTAPEPSGFIFLLFGLATVGIMALRASRERTESEGRERRLNLPFRITAP